MRNLIVAVSLFVLCFSVFATEVNTRVGNVQLDIESVDIVDSQQANEILSGSIFKSSSKRFFEPKTVQNISQFYRSKTCELENCLTGLVLQDISIAEGIGYRRIFNDFGTEARVDSMVDVLNSMLAHAKVNNYGLLIVHNFVSGIDEVYFIDKTLGVVAAQNDSDRNIARGETSRTIPLPPERSFYSGVQE